jgi:CNT family concentrative nucleoside transporter
MTARHAMMAAFVPETETPGRWAPKIDMQKTDVNARRRRRGHRRGLHLAMNVIAMDLVHRTHRHAQRDDGGTAVGLDIPNSVCRWCLVVFAPIAWSLGVPWRDAGTIGNLLGTRMG